MAKSDMKGTVTTTGMMNKGPVMPKGKVNPQLQTGGSQPLPEDPTNPVNPFMPKPTGPVLPNKKIAQNQNNTAFKGTTDLTDEDMETINAALSPSVKNALGKVFPDLKSTIDSRAIYSSAISTVFDVDFKKISKEVFWGENLPNLSDKLFKA